jgi:alpha-ketoglutarate-dependent taurine dioxygenase
MSARELRRLGEALGTEAIGIDLAKPLDAETFAWIEDAFAEHPVLVFREQDLGPSELAAFGRRFGIDPEVDELASTSTAGSRLRVRRALMYSCSPTPQPFTRARAPNTPRRSSL